MSMPDRNREYLSEWLATDRSQPYAEWLIDKEATDHWQTVEPAPGGWAVAVLVVTAIVSLSLWALYGVTR